MDDSQDSTISLGHNVRDRNQPSPDEFKLGQQLLVNEFEREIQCLERDIRQQKESSVNAKTAITFDQLRKIHNLSRIMGSQKEAFFDRICRAAEIQRASLKNRLKQNKERFEPSQSSMSMSTSLYESQGSIPDSQSFLLTQNTFQSLFHNTIQAKTESLQPAVFDEDNLRFPAERQFELLQLGISYDEIKQFLELFERFKLDANTLSLSMLLNQFSNYISLNSPSNLKLVSMAFNLLELGNPLTEIKRVMIKSRRRHDSDIYDDERNSLLLKKECREEIGGLSPSVGGDESGQEKSSSPSIG